MKIETGNAAGLFFPSPAFSQIYYEAVTNALDANATEIKIDIQIRIFTEPETLRVTISDNGTGFTDDSYDRFCRLLKPRDALHKGLGRLVYLRYFQQVDVASQFGDKLRKFSFTENFDGANEIVSESTPPQIPTTLLFKSFGGERLKSYDDLRPKAIKERLIQELYPRLYELKNLNTSLKIEITLQVEQGNPDKDFMNDTQTLTLDQLPALSSITIQDPELSLFDHIKIDFGIQSEFGKNSIITAVCVDGRTINLDLISSGSIPNNYSVIFLFHSPYFTGKADSSRQRLNIENEAEEKALYRVLRRHAAKIISEKIPAVAERNRETKNRFADRFPHLLGYFEEETVGLIKSDDALEFAQRRFFKDQKEILESTHLDEVQFEKSLAVSSRTLTEYILYRNIIIQKLKEMNGQNSEADIHNLIVPRYRTFIGSQLIQSVYSNNAWLLDDKFMTFSTILSDAQMDDVIRKITLSEEQEADAARPDISMIFSNDPTASEKVDVVVVELKKRTNDEKENVYAVTQLLQRAEKLVSCCQNIQRIWYYAVLQINDSFSTRLGQMGFSPLFSKGQVFYREAETKAPDGTKVPTPIFVMSFDAIIDDAECRNSTFLAILREELTHLIEPEIPRIESNRSEELDALPSQTTE